MEKYWFALDLSSSVCKAKHKKTSVSDWIIKVKIEKIEVVRTKNTDNTYIIKIWLYYNYNYNAYCYNIINILLYNNYINIINII